MLAHAAAMVGHGGAGTTLSAMSAGCPLVTVPLFGDQPANGARIAIAGAGVVAPMLELGRSIERVLERDSYQRRPSACRRRCGRYRRSTASSSGCSSAAATSRRSSNGS